MYGGVYAYSRANFVQNGIKGLSLVTIINELDTIIDMNIYKINNSNYSSIIKTIDETKYEIYNPPFYRITTSTLLKKYDIKYLTDYINQCKKENLGEYITKKIEQIIKTGKQNANVRYNLLKSGENMKPYIYIPFGIFYIVVLVGLCQVVYTLVKHKEINYLQFTLITLIAGQLMVIIIGAQAEWPRLFAPALPLILIYVLLFMETVITKKLLNKLIRKYIIKKANT